MREISPSLRRNFPLENTSTEEYCSLGILGAFQILLLKYVSE